MDWALVLSAANILISAAIALILFYVKAKAAKIDQLEKKLDQKAGALIDARFTSVAAEIKAPMLRFEEIVGRIEKRLERGDAAFGEQAEVAHSLDKKIIEAKSELRTWVLENFASANELHELRKSVGDIRVALAGQKR